MYAEVIVPVWLLDAKDDQQYPSQGSAWLLWLIMSLLSLVSSDGDDDTTLLLPPIEEIRLVLA